MGSYNAPYYNNTHNNDLIGKIKKRGEEWKYNTDKNIRNISPTEAITKKNAGTKKRLNGF